MNGSVLTDKCGHHCCARRGSDDDPNSALFIGHCKCPECNCPEESVTLTRYGDELSRRVRDLEAERLRPIPPRMV